jgi:hypothetical protein
MHQTQTTPPWLSGCTGLSPTSLVGAGHYRRKGIMVAAGCWLLRNFLLGTVVCSCHAKPHMLLECTSDSRAAQRTLENGNSALPLFMLVNVACAALLRLQEVTCQRAIHSCPMQGQPHHVALTATSSSCTSRLVAPGAAEFDWDHPIWLQTLSDWMFGDREGGSGDKALAPCIRNHMCHFAATARLVVYACVLTVQPWQPCHCMCFQCL